MSVRGHIQTIQPVYGGAHCASGWRAEKYLAFMQAHGVDIYENEEQTQWEIYIDDTLRTLATDLLACKHAEELATSDVPGRDMAHDLGEFLQEGIGVGDARGYNYILIDWY